MNNLNSVLIEGIIIDEPDYSKTTANPKCSFTVSSKRFFRNDFSQDFETENTEVEIETSGKLAETVATNGKRGRGVRAVGRLKQKHYYDTDGRSASRMIIVAEHVEFRLELTKSSSHKKSLVEGGRLDI